MRLKKNINRGDSISMVCDQIQVCGVKRAKLGKNGCVIFVIGIKN